MYIYSRPHVCNLKFACVLAANPLVVTDEFADGSPPHERIARRAIANCQRGVLKIGKVQCARVLDRRARTNLDGITLVQNEQKRWTVRTCAGAKRVRKCTVCRKAKIEGSIQNGRRHVDAMR
jgi:hypothetical protein